MDPLDPRHGTYAGGQAHTRAREKMCDPCHEAHLRYRRQRSYDIFRGRTRTVPTGPVIEHLQTLRTQGVSVRVIAARSGVSESLVDELLSRPREVIRRDNAEALLGTNPQPTRMGYVPAVGTIRRIRALARIGWSMQEVARASGGRVRLDTLRAVNSVEPEKVRYVTKEAVDDAYRELCMRIPPKGRTPSQVRTRAIRKGWLPPLAYDDIDDPREAPVVPVPATRAADGKLLPQDKADVDESVVLRLLDGDTTIQSTRAEKVEAMRRWLSWGRSEKSLCAIHGWKDSRYTSGKQESAA